MSSSPDHETDVNVFLCYVILGDAGGSKRCFTTIMSQLLNQVGEEEVYYTSKRNNFKGGEIFGDLLEEDILLLSKDAEQVVVTASLLVALVFGDKKWAEGYRWFQSQI